ncbi:MAG: DUF2304 family protein [Clostridia bacterium]|nr:DUF2304 family protein [Clostridia bacterium]
MTTVLLLITSLALGTLGGVLRKLFMKKNAWGNAGSYLFTAICSLFAGIVLVFWGGIGETSRYTLIFGILYGVFTAAQGIAFMFAVQKGPLSYTVVISSFSTVISALSGAMFFDESISWTSIVGIVLMLLSFILAAEKGKDEQKANWVWLIFCVISLLTTGFVGIMQKVHQLSPHKNELNFFLIVAFAVSAVLSAAFAVVLMRSPSEKEEKKNSSLPDGTKKNSADLIIMVLCMVLCGICVSVNNKFNTHLAGVMDSAIFFPLINGGGLILTTVSAFIIFREKFSKKQWIGLVLGILSVGFLCLPF